MKQLVVLIFLCFVLIACEPQESPSDIPTDAPEPQESTPALEEAKTTQNNLPEEIEEPSTVSNQTPTTTSPVACETNTECAGGQLCIDDVCASLEALRSSTDENCERSCSIKELTVKTNEPQTFTGVPGFSTYTAAGALEWRILPANAYCPGEEPIVPFKIFKQSYGETVSDSLVTLRKGQTSRIITHPTISRIAFTLELVDYTEEC